jgi:hypothetical protein
MCCFYCATNAAFTRLFPTIGFQIVTETSSLEDFPCRGIDKLSNSGRSMDFSGGIATDFFKNLFTLSAPSRMAVTFGARRAIKFPPQAAAP